MIFYGFHDLFATCVGIVFLYGLWYRFWFHVGNCLMLCSQLFRNMDLEPVGDTKWFPQNDPLDNKFHSKSKCFATLPSILFSTGICLESPWLIVADVGALLISFCTLLTTVRHPLHHMYTHPPVQPTHRPPSGSAELAKRKHFGVLIQVSYDSNIYPTVSLLVLKLSFEI